MGLLIQIEEIFAEIKFSLISHHVKGHQDKLSKPSNTKNNEDKDKKKDQKITWQAKLNIRADQLATEAKKELYNKSVKTNFTILPAAKAYLCIGTLPIMRHIREAITLAWSTQDQRNINRTTTQPCALIGMHAGAY
eukprot:9472653-Ditylum_brightwellii.AAC.1